MERASVLADIVQENLIFVFVDFNIEVMYSSVAALVLGLRTALTSAHRSYDRFQPPRGYLAPTAVCLS